MAEFRLDEITSEVTKVLKDALYIGVGFGVLTFQKIQVQRQELMKQLDSRFGAGKEQLDAMRDTLESQVRTLEERLDAVEEKIDAALDQVQGKLPDQAAELLGQARSAVKSARKQVHDLVRREEQPAA